MLVSSHDMRCRRCMHEASLIRDHYRIEVDLHNEFFFERTVVFRQKNKRYCHMVLTQAIRPWHLRMPESPDNISRLVELSTMIRAHQRHLQEQKLTFAYLSSREPASLSEMVRSTRTVFQWRWNSSLVMPAFMRERMLKRK